MPSVRTPTRVSWEKMIARCYQLSDRKYPSYGAKGVTVSDEWRTFSGFHKDMGDRPEGCTLDRIDGSKGYSKANCRWATPKEQANNMKSNVFIEHNGISKTIAQWSDEVGLSWSCIKARLSRGLPSEMILYPGNYRNKEVI